jgi:hypothetical protein
MSTNPGNKVLKISGSKAGKEDLVYVVTKLGIRHIDDNYPEGTVL